LSQSSEHKSPSPPLVFLRHDLSSVVVDLHFSRTISLSWSSSVDFFESEVCFWSVRVTQDRTVSASFPRAQGFSFFRLSELSHHLSAHSAEYIDQIYLIEIIHIFAQLRFYIYPIFRIY
jgi:hypothetical protein